MKFYRNERIGEIAEQRVREFEGKLGRPLSIPVDIELFGDLVLGLSMLWENIDELPGEEVLAGLRRLAGLNSMPASILTSTTAMLSPATAPRGLPPSASSFTPTRVFTRICSTQDLPTFRSRVLATMP
jgi:hypothetical protein